MKATAEQSESYVKEIKRIHDTTRARVAKVIGESEENLILFFHESAYEFLELITGDNEKAIQYLPRTKEFWGYWKRVWQNADFEFLNHVRDYACESVYSRRELFNLYKYFHRITLDNPTLNNATVQAGYYMIMRTATKAKIN
jgi:hypothetical protein